MARMYRAALAAAVFSGVVMVAAPAQPLAARTANAITDPQLLNDIARATAQRTEGGPLTVAVEVLSDNPDAVASSVVALGGTVTGSVPGEVLQARMPISQLDALAAAPAARHLQSPRLSGYVPSSMRRTEAGFGSTVGSEVVITGADEWHDAGLTGAGVKVGIVDYFVMASWNTNEHGPKPTPGNGKLFCQDSAGFGLCIGPDIDNDQGDIHGLAVAEVVKDMAPGAELYIATVGTVSDLQAAVNWFAANGVKILTRSLGAAYDGPGDGTGPLAAVVDSAINQGMTWFNSAGNDAQDAYMRRTVSATVSANAYGVTGSGGGTSAGTGQYVDFDSGAGVDTWLRLDAGQTGCVLFDGIRWSNDWYLPANQRTDYSIEFWEPVSSANQFNDHWNPTAANQVKGIDLNPFSSGTQHVYDASQIGGAAPLEVEDWCIVPDNLFEPFYGIVLMRMRRNTTTPVGNPDIVEIALADGLTELDYYSIGGSAGKPVVDSKNGGAVAVGAVDPPAGTAIGAYSSQGPTNDGRIKPDMSAPAGFNSTSYGEPFSGTSAASPVAAGAAALLLGANLATPGGGVAALVKHFTTDLGTPGPDNTFGTGKLLLPFPPGAASAATPGKYVPLALPVRGLDTRPGGQHVGPAALTGPYQKESVIDFDVLGETIVPDTGVSAVVINLTSVGAPSTGFLQAYPYLRASNGQTSTLNISTVTAARPNFAIVPVGVDGQISVYIQSGGNVIIDVLGYYVDGQGAGAADGRFVPLDDPERWMDSRGQSGAPLPVGFGSPRLANTGETVGVATLPTTEVPATAVSALVVNITATNAQANGFLQAIPTGAVGAIHSNVNYTVGSASANTAIIPLGDGDGISVITSQSTHIIVDVVGYITDSSADVDTLGLFVPIVPGRAYNSRTGPAFTAGESRTITLTGLSPAPLPVVPPGAAGVSANLTVVSPTNGGFLKVYPNTEPNTSNLNFATGKTVANAALLALNGSGQVTAKMSQPGHVLIDINGYFMAASV